MLINLVNMPVQLDATSVLSTMLTNLGSIVTSVASQVGTWLSQVFATGNEYLQLCVLVAFVGIGIGAIRRLTRI